MKPFLMFLDFEPVPTARAKAGVNCFYDPQQPLKNALGLMINSKVAKYKGWKLYEGPLAVGIIFNITRPKKHYRTGKFSHLFKEAALDYYPTKADFDNYTKFICDAMNEKVYVDDRQIIKAVILKQFTPRGSIEVMVGPWKVRPMTIFDLTVKLFE